MKLGDCFPEKERRAYVRRTLTIGSIILLDCSFTNPPKSKFCILLCLEPEAVLALVNSKISKFQEDRPALRDCQVLLHCNHHSFLQHDSYIDCAKAHKISISDIEDQLLKDPLKLKGVITQGEKDAIRYAISTARTIESRIKNWISEALSEP